MLIQIIVTEGPKETRQSKLTDPGYPKALNLCWFNINLYENIIQSWSTIIEIKYD